MKLTTPPTVEEINAIRLDGPQKLDAIQIAFVESMVKLDPALAKSTISSKTFIYNIACGIEIGMRIVLERLSARLDASRGPFEVDQIDEAANRARSL